MAEVARAVGLGKEQHIANVHYGARSEERPCLKSGDRNEGQKGHGQGHLRQRHRLDRREAIPVCFNKRVPDCVHYGREQYDAENLDRHRLGLTSWLFAVIERNSHISQTQSRCCWNGRYEVRWGRSLLVPTDETNGKVPPRVGLRRSLRTLCGSGILN